jgi:hypothetical protein
VKELENTILIMPFWDTKGKAIGEKKSNTSFRKGK